MDTSNFGSSLDGKFGASRGENFGAKLGQKLSAQLATTFDSSFGASLTNIALDAMGSDKAPGPEIDGAILACRNLPVRILLVGPRDRLEQELAARPRSRRLPIEIVHASEWITMDDKAAAAVRSKRDSTMRVGCKLVREGKAAGFVTAGNTGAAMATSKMVFNMIPGVDRPALTAVLPTSTGSPCIFLDVGANVDCKAQNLVQFAVMGEMYARAVLGIARPASACSRSAKKRARATSSLRRPIRSSSRPASQTSSATSRAATSTTVVPT